MRLYGFWRSAASYRVRVALNIKGIEREEISVDMLQGMQFDEAYRRMNPQCLLPALLDGDGDALTESMAIIEYLDEIRPAPPLLPGTARERARVRALAQVLCADSHPLIVPRVRKRLAETFGAADAQIRDWVVHWIGSGLAAVEALVHENPQTGRFCHGDQITIADICLASQVVTAELFKVDLVDFPTVRRLAEEYESIEHFARAHPLRQPDAK